MTDQLVRDLAEFLADVAANDPPVPVQHAGPAGQRCEAPCGNRDLEPYLAGERLHNGDTACHRCGRRFRPHELAEARHCSRRPR